MTTMNISLPDEMKAFIDTASMQQPAAVHGIVAIDRWRSRRVFTRTTGNGPDLCPDDGGPMPRHRVSAEAVINAPAEEAYAIIADYRDGHPRIMPRPPFVSLDVEQGGIGAGTVIRCVMRMFGRTQTFRAAISEPEPGRVLVETFEENGTVTTYNVDPVSDGTRVTITTDFETRRGLIGWIEGFSYTRLLRPVYLREIAQLGIVASERATRG